MDDEKVEVAVEPALQEPTPAPLTYNPEHASVADAQKAGVKVSHQGTPLAVSPQSVKEFYQIFVNKITEMEDRISALEDKSL